MEEAYDRGRPFPQSYLDRPELNILEIGYWQAFNELSSSRQSGMGLGFIPYSEISAYLDEHHILDYEERFEWRYLITAIDTEFITIKNAEHERKTKVKNKPKK